MRVLILLALILSTSFAVIGRTRLQTREDKLSPRESLEVKHFIRILNGRLRRSRDLRPFLTEPLASTWLDKILLEKDSLIPLVSRELISQRNVGNLRDFWIATSNLAYLSELYLYTKRDVYGIRTYELPLDEQYPPSVARLIKRNPNLLKWWSNRDSPDVAADSVEQLRGLTRTFQDAASLMRGLFKAHPPERTRRYRKNIAAQADYLGVTHVSTCETEENCSGLPLHTKTISVNVPVLTLMLAWVDGQLQIMAIGIIND
jgi:hypothetical protein